MKKKDSGRKYDCQLDESLASLATTNSYNNIYLVILIVSIFIDT